MVVGGLAPLFCCVDGFIISRLYFLCHNFPKVSELNSKRLFDLTYYDANTSRENIENRAAAIKHVCDNFTKNTTYAIFMIRYANGYYFNYIFTRTPSATNVVMEYTYYTPINMWRDISSGWKIEKTFSDDATVFNNIFIKAQKNNIDYNELEPGIHYCGTGCTNAPGSFMRVLCLYGGKEPGSDSIQIAFGVIDGNIYKRVYLTGSWTGWYKYEGASMQS